MLKDRCNIFFLLGFRLTKIKQNENHQNQTNKQDIFVCERKTSLVNQIKTLRKKKRNENKAENSASDFSCSFDLGNSI